MSRVIRGRCLCGALRYQFTEPLRSFVHCHCSMCRKHHGAAFASFAGAPLASLRWLQGQDAPRRYASSASVQRSFCGECGSVAPELFEEGGLAFAPAGNLEGELGLEPQCHYFAASRAPWYEIRDGLPQYDAYPPELGRSPVPQPSPELAADRVGGGCLCGEQRFELEGPAQRMWNCHCSRCRLARSAAHACNVFYAAEQLRWTREQRPRAEYRLPGARYFATAFCTRCGSSLPRVSQERGLAVVPAGSLDRDPGLRPAAHIWVGSKAPWFEIADALPQHAESPPPA
jgi:hypothetical protein